MDKKKICVTNNRGDWFQEFGKMPLFVAEQYDDAIKHDEEVAFPKSGF